MKLGEKILYCRKKAGLSQEALAEKLGVSRQAVSKWENGETAPDLEKLVLLTQVFGVTADWLLSQEAQAEEPKKTPEPTWVDRLPGMLGRLIRRYGWLAGVRMAITGLGFSFIGGLSRAFIRRMFSGFGSMTTVGGMTITGGFPGMTQSVDLATSNPVYMMGTAILAVGVVLTIAGVILAVYLKKHSGRGDEK